MATGAGGAAALLMLADSRLPAGGHAHSGGVEAALAAGLVGDVDGLARFLRGRLWTAGLTAAGLAAAAARIAGPAAPAGRSTPDRVPAGREPSTGRPAGDQDAGGRPASRGAAVDPDAERGRDGGERLEAWRRLDAEADARIPSPAQRAASRQQGRALLRAGRAAWPAAPDLAALPGGPHHPVALGAVATAAGCDPAGAALVAGYLAVSGPASAALRLRGLDPLAVHAVLAGLAGDIEAVAARAAAAAGGPLADLPCPAAPRLDLLAELHARSEVRLFAS